MERCRILPCRLPAEAEVDGDKHSRPASRVGRKRRREIRAVFDRLDADNSQRVSAKNVARFARELTSPEGFFSEHDYRLHKDGLTYEQFESLIIRKERAPAAGCRADPAAVAQVYNEGPADGRISKKELQVGSR
eukprot:jgi/Tetstr1/422446/TSEL_013284.t1